MRNNFFNKSSDFDDVVHRIHLNKNLWKAGEQSKFKLCYLLANALRVTFPFQFGLLWKPKVGGCSDFKNIGWTNIFCSFPWKYRALTGKTITIHLQFDNTYILSIHLFISFEFYSSESVQYTQVITIHAIYLHAHSSHLSLAHLTPQSDSDSESVTVTVSHNVLSLVYTYYIEACIGLYTFHYMPSSSWMIGRHTMYMLCTLCNTCLPTTDLEKTVIISTSI